MLRASSLVVSFVLLGALFQQKSCDKQPATSGTAGSGSGSSAPRAGETDTNAAEREIRRKIDDLRNALESKMARSVIREMDPVETSNYAGFEEQIQALMDSTSELRLFLRPAGIQVKPAEAGRPARAQAQVDAEMRYALKSNPSQQKEKRQQLLMDFVQGELGWRIAKIEPRSFFTP